MSEQSVEERVSNIVCDQLGTSRDKISLETSFINDLGADSLDTVELVMEFEDEFGINIPDEDAEKIQTVGDAVRYIQEKLWADWLSDPQRACAAASIASSPRSSSLGSSTRVIASLGTTARAVPIVSVNQPALQGSRGVGSPDPSHVPGRRWPGFVLQVGGTAAPLS